MCFTTSAPRFPKVRLFRLRNKSLRHRANANLSVNVFPTSGLAEEVNRRRFTGLIVALMGVAIFSFCVHGLWVNNPWRVFSGFEIPDGGRLLPAFDPFAAVKGFLVLGIIGMSLALIGTAYAASHVSLVSVLASIALALITTSMFAPALRMPYEYERRNVCRLRLQELGFALERYAKDHQGLLPDKGLWQLWEDGYVHNRRVFFCPSAHASDPRQASNSQDLRTGIDCDYLYFSPTAMHANARAYVLAMDKPPNHRGYGLALYSDGRIRAFAGEKWWTQTGADLSRATMEAPAHGIGPSPTSGVVHN